MPEPGSDRVDIYTGTQEKDGCGMANRVRADAFALQRRDLGSRFVGATFYQRVDAVAGNRPTATVKKDRLGGCPFRYER